MIVAIITAVIFPSVNDYQQTLAYKSDIKKIYSDIKFVQQQSIITAVQHGIVFDLNNDCYYLIQDKKTPQVLEKIRLKKVKIKNVNFPDYHQLSFSGPAIFYKQLGNLDHRNGRIKLKYRDKEKEIIFSSNAGEINLK